MLRRMAELGMELIELTAGEAKHSPPEPAPQNPAATRPKPTESRLVFARLTRDVRETLALEARLAAGKLPAAPRPEQPASRADPRRLAILQWLNTEIAATPRPKPERTELARQVEARVAEHLADDPELTLPGANIIHAICEEFALTFNPRTMADELLLRPGQPFPTYQPDIDYEEDDDEEFSLHGPDPP